MTQALTPHPSTPCPAARALSVEARREGARLALVYRLTGALGDLAIPAAAGPAWADGLWEHTCFEAFASTGGEDYLEFNLSPSRQWAAYRFDGYRTGMARLQIAPPRVEVRQAGETLELRADIELPLSGSVRLGLTAVIETTDRSMSYWALQHPPGRPDFHHPDARVLAV